MQYIKNHPWMTIILIIVSTLVYMNYTRDITSNSLINTEDVQYVNNLYMSDGYFYSKLGPEEKKLYMYLLDKAKKRITPISIYPQKFGFENTNELYTYIPRVQDAMVTDHPELMSYGYISGYDNRDTYFDVSVSYTIRLSLVEQIQTYKMMRIIDDIKKATKDMSDKEKIIYVYDWMGENNSYDQLFTSAAKNQSIYNVFIKHNAVCAGFAKASQVIFQNIGIKAYGVTGYASENADVGHMWNVVVLNAGTKDEKYYNYDSTVSACIEKGSPRHYDGLNQSAMAAYYYDHPEHYKDLTTTEDLLP